MNNSIEKILPYIPDRILLQLKTKEKRALVRTEKLAGAVIYFDVAGFTSITEFLAQWERGAETMQETLTEYYTLILSIVRDYSGFAYQFAGDSVMVAFVREKEESSEALAFRAATCALMTQAAIKQLNDSKTDERQIKISVKASIAEGEFYQIILGSISNYFNSTITGNPIEEALAGDILAKNDEIIVSNAFWKLLPAQKKGDARGSFYILSGIESGVNSISESIRFDHNPADEKKFKAYSRFIHPVLLNKLQSEHHQFFGDFREVTSVFAGFNLKNENAGIKEKVKIWNDFYDYLNQTSTLYGGALLQIDFTNKGDVFLILFGAPQGLENKEIMAARFALKIESEIGRFEGIKNLRIGISTGNSYCGDLGARFRKGYTVVSKSTNLASRLMTSGGEQGIYIDSDSCTKLANRFKVIQRESSSLKGIKDITTFYSLIEEREISKEINTLFHEPILGRKKDLANLEYFYENTQNGQFTFVSLEGEAGIGKSRLLAAFLERIDSEKSLSLVTSCYPYEKNTPFFAWREIISGIVGIHEDDDSGFKHKTLKNALSELDNVDTQWAAVIARLIGLQIEEGPLTKDLEPNQKKERLFQIILDLIRTRAKQQSLVLCFEDVHWIDEASLVLLQNIVSHLKSDAVMLLLVCRPWEYLENFTQSESLHRIQLNELDDDVALELIRNKLNLQENNPDLESSIYSSSRGNPFFIESIIHNLVDTGVIRPQNNDKNTLQENTSEIKIPNTLQDVILARIDRLDENEQAVLKTAAVIGRVFMFHLLQKMTPAMENATLVNQLRALEKLDLTPMETENPLAYIFKHILIRDVAYNTLLTSTRQKLHLELATILEKEHQGNPLDIVGTLSYHYMEGGNPEKGLLYSLMAARSAMEQYANRDAIHYYEQALRVFQKKIQEANPDREYQIKEELAAACRNSGDFERARYLFAECIAYHKEPLKLAKLYIGLGQIFQEQGDNLLAIDKMENALKYLGAKAPANQFQTIISLVSELIIRGFHRFLPFTILKITSDEEKYKLRSQVIMVLEKIYFFKNVKSVAWSGFAHINLAERINADYDLSLAYSNYGTIMEGLGLHKTARQYFEKSANMAQKSGRLYAEGLSFQRYGLSGLFLNDPEFILEKETQSIQIFKQIGEVWETLTSMIIVAIGYSFAGDLKKSNSILEEMKVLSVEIDSRMHLGWVLARQAFNDYMLNNRNYFEIMDDLDRSIELALESQDKTGLITTYYFLVSILTQEDRIPEALDMAQQAYMELIGYGVKMPHLTYGFIHICEASLHALRSKTYNNKKNAENLFQKASRELKKNAKAFDYLVGPALRIQSLYFEIKGKNNKAKTKILEAINTLKIKKNRFEYALALLDASRILNEFTYRLEARKILNELGIEEDRVQGS